MITQRRLRGWKSWGVHGGEVGVCFVAAFVVIFVAAAIDLVIMEGIVPTMLLAMWMTWRDFEAWVEEWNSSRN